MNTFKHALATLPILAVLGCESAEPDLNTLDCSLDTYRIVAVDLAQRSESVTDSALDLDGDGRVDNAGGGALSLLLREFGSADGLPDLINQRLVSDEAPWFIALNQCPDGSNLFWSLRGQDLNTDGIYELSNRSSPPARGRLEDSTVQVRNGGFGEIPVGLFADPLGEADQVWSTGAGLAAEFTIEDGDMVGKLGLGLANDYVEIIGGPLAAFLTSRLQAGTSEFAKAMDTNEDGVVSLAEFKNNALVGAILLNRDLDLLRNNVYNPGRDGVEDSLSFGISFRAEPVDVTFQQ